MKKEKTSIYDVCRKLTEEDLEFEKWKFEYMDKLGIELYLDERHSSEKRRKKAYLNSDEYEMDKMEALGYILEHRNVPKELEDKLISAKELREKLKLGK